ncbi:cytochrome P450, partial [Vararia minispora EC-137]
LGNLEEIFNPFAHAFISDVSNRYGSVIKINGFLGDIQLLVSDTKALTHVLVKDGAFWESDDFTVALGAVTFGPGFFGTIGAPHQRQRKQFMPVFTAANLRTFFPTFEQLTLMFQDRLRGLIARDGSATKVDIMPYATRLSLELIGVIAFGHSFDAAADGGKDEYSESLARVFPTVSKMQRWAPLLPIFRKLFSPEFCRRLVEMSPFKPIHEYKNIVDTVHRNSVDIMQRAKALALSSSNAHGEDKNATSALRQVIEANAKRDDSDRSSDAELYAQINSILFAGTEAGAVTVARILLTLAENPKVQETLRRELSEAGQLDHDKLMALPYLDAIYKETMRLYPPVWVTYRQAYTDCVLPLGRPVLRTDGIEVDNVFVPKNTVCLVNIVGANRDPLTWGADAQDWRPERWLSPLPDSVAKAQVPSLYANTLSFAAGTRGCIGHKFAHIATKTVIAHLVSEFSFTITDRRILWKSGTIVSPCIDPAGPPSLPLLVTRVEKE